MPLHLPQRIPLDAQRSHLITIGYTVLKSGIGEVVDRKRCIIERKERIEVAVQPVHVVHLIVLSGPG